MAKTVHVCDNEGVRAASDAVSYGGVIIFPTDTVYGIGCDPYEKDAVRRIYEIKGRPAKKNLPVLASSYASLEKFCTLDARHKRMADKFWPGPLTMIVRMDDERMKYTMNLEKTVAVRIPAGECASAVLDSCGPLACTSANVSGGPPAVEYPQCAKLGADVGLDGGIIRGGSESVILDTTCEEPRILRQGPISGEDVYRQWRG